MPSSSSPWPSQTLPPPPPPPPPGLDLDGFDASHASDGGLFTAAESVLLARSLNAADQLDPFADLASLAQPHTRHSLPTSSSRSRAASPSHLPEHGARHDPGRASASFDRAGGSDPSSGFPTLHADRGAGGTNASHLQHHPSSAAAGDRPQSGTGPGGPFQGSSGNPALRQWLSSLTADPLVHHMERYQASRQGQASPHGVSDTTTRGLGLSSSPWSSSTARLQSPAPVPSSDRKEEQPSATTSRFGGYGTDPLWHLAQVSQLSQIASLAPAPTERTPAAASTPAPALSLSHTPYSRGFFASPNPDQSRYPPNATDDFTAPTSAGHVPGQSLRPEASLERTWSLLGSKVGTHLTSSHVFPTSHAFSSSPAQSQAKYSTPSNTNTWEAAGGQYAKAFPLDERNPAQGQGPSLGPGQGHKNGRTPHTQPTAQAVPTSAPAAGSAPVSTAPVPVKSEKEPAPKNAVVFGSVGWKPWHYVDPKQRVVDVSRVPATAFGPLAGKAQEAGFWTDLESQLQPHLSQMAGTPASTSTAPLGRRRRDEDREPGVLLTEAEKKANHIASEQKRRTNIKRGYEGLSSRVPALRAESKPDESGEKKKKKKRGAGDRPGAPSEAYVLSKSLDYIREQLNAHSALLARRRALRIAVAQAVGYDVTLPEQR